MQTQLTKDEQTFIARMVPHIEAGKSLEDAARAVLQDDERLYKTFCGYEYSPARKEEQNELRRTLSDQVYSTLRAAA